MSFEDSAGINVSNHYGPRSTGGTEGVVKTEGTRNEFTLDVEGDGLDFGFPTVDGTAYVTIIDFSQSNGTTFTIGGVDVTLGSAVAPIEIPDGNTGVIVTDATTGKIVVEFKKYAL